jgi:hypothetical protein
VLARLQLLAANKGKDSISYEASLSLLGCIKNIASFKSTPSPKDAVSATNKAVKDSLSPLSAYCLVETSNCTTTLSRSDVGYKISIMAKDLVVGFSVETVYYTWQLVIITYTVVLRFNTKLYGKLRKCGLGVEYFK